MLYNLNVFIKGNGQVFYKKDIVRKLFSYISTEVQIVRISKKM